MRNIDLNENSIQFNCPQCSQLNGDAIYIMLISDLIACHEFFVNSFDSSLPIHSNFIVFRFCILTYFVCVVYYANMEINCLSLQVVLYTSIVASTSGYNNDVTSCCDKYVKLYT